MAGDGIVPGGMGLFRKLNRAQPQSVATVGSFELSFPQAFRAFLCRLVDANGLPVSPSATVSLRIGHGSPDDGANLVSGTAPALASLRDVIDPVAVPYFEIDGGETRKLYVHVLGVQAATFLEVTGIDGRLLLRQPTAAEIGAAITVPTAAAIAAAIAAVTLTANASIVQYAHTWGAPAAVAMGAASAVALNANANRRAFTIQNTGIVNVAIRLAAAAAVFASDHILVPGQPWTEGLDGGTPCYRGEIRGITGGAAGELRVSEAT